MHSDRALGYLGKTNVMTWYHPVRDMCCDWVLRYAGKSSDWVLEYTGKRSDCILGYSGKDSDQVPVYPGKSSKGTGYLLKKGTRLKISCYKTGNKNMFHVPL